MSKFQQQIVSGHRSACYGADFEAYQSSPVHIVQCFSVLAHDFTQGDPGFRRVREYRTPEIMRVRNTLCARLRYMRACGLNRDDVRAMAWKAITAPESYGGEVRSGIRAEIRVELRKRFDGDPHRRYLIAEWWGEYGRVLRREMNTAGSLDKLNEITRRCEAAGVVVLGCPMPRDGAEAMARECDELLKDRRRLWAKV